MGERVNILKRFFLFFSVLLIMGSQEGPAVGETWTTIDASGWPNYRFGSYELIMGWDDVYASYGVRDFNFVNKLDPNYKWYWSLWSPVASTSFCRLRYYHTEHSGNYVLYHFRVECSGDYCPDNDHDGHYAVSPTCPQGDDSDDGDRTKYPGAPEYCDNKDNNGNALVDEGCWGNSNLTTCPD